MKTVSKDGKTLAFRDYIPVYDRKCQIAVAPGSADNYPDSYIEDGDIFLRCWSIEYSVKAVHNHADKLLAASDWTQIGDQNSELRASYVIYRQALKDIRADDDLIPSAVIWPDKPE